MSHPTPKVRCCRQRGRGGAGRELLTLVGRGGWRAADVGRVGRGKQDHFIVVATDTMLRHVRAPRPPPPPAIWAVVPAGDSVLQRVHAAPQGIAQARRLLPAAVA